MKIGDRYSDNKIYRGIKTYNNLPLLSEDLQEFSDTLMAKNNHLLENILGSGIINSVNPSISQAGVRLSTPVVLNVEGDICLIGNSPQRMLVDTTQLDKNSSTSLGNIFIVGWYQHITATSNIREYGGLMNDTLPNDLVYTPLDMQVSTRYQFVWDTAIYVGDLSSDSFSINFAERDEEGALSGSSYLITPTSKVGSIYKATPPPSMSFVVDDLYLIPLFQYEYNATTDTISSIRTYPVRRTSASMSMVESNVEPTGMYTTGTVWYNPGTDEFKTYIEGKGFISNSSKVGLVKYQYVDIATVDSLTPTNMSYDISNTVPDIQESDILHVTYEGLDLLLGEDYTIDTSRGLITLLNFTRSKGEVLIVDVTRLVEVSNVTNIAKMVEDSKIMKDTSTGSRYSFSVENGMLYINNIDSDTKTLLTNLS